MIGLTLRLYPGYCDRAMLSTLVKKSHLYADFISFRYVGPYGRSILLVRYVGPYGSSILSILRDLHAVYSSTK